MAKTRQRLPTVAQRVLGAALERHRNMAGLQRGEAADALGWSASKVYRIETARSTVSTSDLQQLAQLYRLDDDRGKALVALARQVTQPGWWSGVAQDLPAGFPVHLELESDARAICTYEAQFVPGLWQTADYARAVLRARSVSCTPEQVERQVEVRMRRQEILGRASPPPPRLWVILDEAVIRRAVGGRSVMRAQLRRLGEMPKAPQVTLQVLPFSAGAHMAAYGSFALFDPSDSALPLTASTDRPAGTLIEADPSAIDQYSLIFDHLRATALNTPQSLALIDEAGKLL